MAIENTDIPKALESETWREALNWIKHIDWQRVDSFRLQVNFKREIVPLRAERDGGK